MTGKMNIAQQNLWAKAIDKLQDAAEMFHDCGQYVTAMNLMCIVEIEDGKLEKTLPIVEKKWGS